MVELQTITLAIQAVAAFFVVGGAAFEVVVRFFGRDGPLVSLMQMSKQHTELQETMDCVEGKVNEIDDKVEVVEDITIGLAYAHNEEKDVPLDSLREEYGRSDDPRSRLWNDPEVDD